MTLDQLLELAIQSGASDLHLSPKRLPMLRINGELNSITQRSPLGKEEIEKFIYNLLDTHQQKIFKEQLEIDLAIRIPLLGSFRINVFHQLNGISAVFRVIPFNVPTLEELNLPLKLHELLRIKNGIILITGPTGSGKSTTLAAMVDHINRHHALHIITIEDPIEFIYESKKSLINQRQIQRDTHSFANALRSALREDPDIILVGELRDLETIRLALTAAETGHLVLATLHTRSAASTVNRIVDVFPGAEKDSIRQLFSESIQAVISQQLVSTSSGKRAAAFEIMLGTPAIRNLIKENKIAQIYSAIQMGHSLGMCTFEQSLQNLIDRNIIK